MPTPRKTSRQPGGPPPRRRQVAGTRTRRPVGAAGQADAADDTRTGTETRVELLKGAEGQVAARTSIRPRPSPRPASPAPAEKAARRRLRLPAVRLPAGRLVPGLVAATVILAIAVGVLGWFSWQQAQTDEARSAALAAARSHAQRILSYDYRRIDADAAAAKRVTTGSFRAEYTKTVTTVVKPTAIQYKAVVSAQVRAASVRSVSPDKVVVLLFVNQTTTSTRITGPKVDQSRVRMTLAKRGDDWFVSEIDAL